MLCSGGEKEAFSTGLRYPICLAMKIASYFWSFYFYSRPFWSQTTWSKGMTCKLTLSTQPSCNFDSSSSAEHFLLGQSKESELELRTKHQRNCPSDSWCCFHANKQASPSLPWVSVCSFVLADTQKCRLFRVVSRTLNKLALSLILGFQGSVMDLATFTLLILNLQ